MGPGRALVVTLAFGIAGCGGRAHEDGARQDSTPSRGSARDPNRLAQKRCADFALPELEPTFIALGAGVPTFGACGHVHAWTEDGIDIYSPDLKTIVAHALDTPKFSPEGSRLAFLPSGADGVIVRRLDLVTGRTFDTRLEAGSSPLDANYGVFLDDQGEVQSWVCDEKRVRVFADRVPGEAPIFESQVPYCRPDVAAQDVLLWHDGDAVHALDLRQRRLYDHVLPEYGLRAADELTTELNGYAVAPRVHGPRPTGGDTLDSPLSTGPLYSTRTGEKLAEHWEAPYGSGPNSAVNRLDEDDVTLLVDDGDGIRALPGLRGLYVFRDRARAFVLHLDTSGGTELAFADLTTGRLTPIMPYPLPSLSYFLGYQLGPAVSPDETAAYLVTRQDTDPSTPSDQPRALFRWLNGELELLPDSIDATAETLLVADNGTALITGSSATYWVRPGLETMKLPLNRGLVLNAAGTQTSAVATLVSTAESYLAELTLVDVESGEKRALISNLSSSATVVTDRAHARLGLTLEMGDGPRQLWVGRFP